MDLLAVSGLRPTTGRMRPAIGADDVSADRTGTPIDEPAAVAEFSTWSVAAAAAGDAANGAGQRPLGRQANAAIRTGVAAMPEAPRLQGLAHNPDVLRGRTEPVGAILDHTA